MGPAGARGGGTDVLVVGVPEEAEEPLDEEVGLLDGGVVRVGPIEPDQQVPGGEVVG